MARENVEFEIDERKYIFGRRKPMKAILLAREISSVILPVIGKSGDLLSDGLDTDLDLSAMINKLFEILDEDKFESLLKKCLSNAYWVSPGYTDSPVSEKFDEVFLGQDATHIFKVTKKALEVDLSSFLGEKFSGLLKKAQEKTKKALPI